MRLKPFITISSIISGVILAALFVLQAIMPGVAEHWIDQGTELHATQKILIGLAVFWSRFWWLAWPLVVLPVCLFVGLMLLLKHAVAKKRLS
jgi:type II secretory pathway component PulF